MKNNQWAQQGEQIWNQSLVLFLHISNKLKECGNEYNYSSSKNISNTRINLTNVQDV